MRKSDRPYGLLLIVALVTACAVATMGALGTVEAAQYTLYATTVQGASPWQNPEQATGNPSGQSCNSSANPPPYATNASSTDTTKLKANAWQTLTLPSDERITKVEVDVYCRYNQNTTSNRVRLRVAGNVPQTDQNSPLWNQGTTDCQWRMGGNGWDVTNLRTSWTPTDIANLRVRVRRKVTNAGGSKTTLRVNGFRIVVSTAKCSVSPTSLAFGNVNVGATSPQQTFTISNTGTGNLTGTVSSCGAFVVTDGGAYSIPGGGSRVFHVQFQPTAAGSQSCTIATGCPVGVSVSGTGVGPLCTVSPTALDFGVVALGSSSNRTFRITNVGGGTLSGSVTVGCPDFALLTSASYTLGAGQFKDFTVSFTPSQIGTANCTITTGTGCSNPSATGNGQPLPTVQYVTEGAARTIAGITLDVVGSLGDTGLGASLIRSGEVPVAASTVSSVDTTRAQLQFDLTGVAPGLWDLVFTNAVASDTLQRAVVIHSDAYDLFRSTRSLAADVTPALNGDSIVAFVSSRDGSPKLYRKGVDALDIVPLTPLLDPVLVNVQEPDWSNDDARIVCVVPGGIFSLNVQVPADTLRLTTNGQDRRPRWSPAQSEIAFTRPNLNGDREVWVMDSSGGNLRNLSTPPSGESDGSLDWSPDGKALVVARQSAGGSVVYRMDATLGEAGGLDTLSASTGFVNTEPAWSPDGQWIAFASDRDGDFDIYVMDSRGESLGLLQITDDPAEDRDPSWSADGTKLVFSSSRSGGVFDVFSVKVTPTSVDIDADAVPDVVDACVGDAPNSSEVDRDRDGCPDATSSFRGLSYWRPDRFPVVYEIEPAGDTRIPDGSDLQAVRNAFATWGGIPGTTIRFTEDASAPLSRAQGGDGRNTITFSDVAGFTDGDPTIADGILAVTIVTWADTSCGLMVNGRWYAPGEIIDADVLFNTARFSFSTPSYDGGPLSWDLQSVATHEVGHLLGISHAFRPADTMYWVVPLGSSARTLKPDDRVVAERLYDPSALALAVEGRVVIKGAGAAGAALYAISAATGDTLQATLSGEDGTYRFFDIAEDFKIFATPLDGSPSVAFTQPGIVNPQVQAVAEPTFIGEWWDAGAEATIDPNTGTVITVAEQPRLAEDFVVTTDSIPPSVVSFSPGPGDTVDVVTTLAVRFTEPVRLLAQTASANLILKPTAGGAAVSGVGALLEAEDNEVIRFTPDAPLAPDTEYLFVVGPDIPDEAGNPMVAPDSVVFRTAPAPPLALASLSPTVVPVGGILVIKGSGFAAPDTLLDTVTFSPSGITTNPFVATLDQLWVRVPAGVTDGSLTVTVGATTSNALAVDIADPKTIPSGNLVFSDGLSGTPRAVTVNDDSLIYVATDFGVEVFSDGPQSAQQPIVSFPIPGGAVDVASLPGHRRVLAIGSSPPTLYTIDESDQVGMPPSMNPVLVDALSSEPLGMAVVPGGDEVLIAYAGRVTLHNVDPTASGLAFGDAIHEWTSPSENLNGTVAVDPEGKRGYAGTVANRVAIVLLDSLPASGVQATPFGYEDAGTSVGGVATLQDGSGFLAVGSEVALFNPLGVEKAVLHPDEGTLASIRLSPEGGFAYATDLVTDRVRVLDLRGGTVLDSGTFPTGRDPIDIATSNDGRFLYVVTQGLQRLETYDTVGSPILRTVFPTSGGPGTLLTVAGSGLDPVAQQDTVWLGGVAHVPVDADTNRVVFAQLGGVQTGALQVVSFGLKSNALSYTIVGRNDPGSFVLAQKVATGQPAVRHLATSPDGRALFVVHADGSLVVLDAEPGSGEFHRPSQTLTPVQTSLGGASPVAVVPDGTKLYVGDAASGRVVVFEVTGAPADSVRQIGVVADATDGVNLQPAAYAITPDGRRLLVTSTARGLIYEVSTRTDSALARISGVAAPGAVFIHPLGVRAYVADGGQIRVVDIDDRSPSYRSVIASIPITGATQIQLAGSRDGDRLWAVSRLSSGTDYQLDVIDVAGTTPSHGVLATLPLSSGASLPLLQPNNTGSLLYLADLNGQLERVYDLQTGIPSLLSGSVVSAPELGGAVSMAISQDDARLYVAGSGDSILVTNLTPATSIRFQAGLQQTGIQGQPLPVPLVARVLGGSTTLLRGSLVTFRSSASQGTFGVDNVAYAAANAQGLVEVTTFQPSALGTVSITADLGNATDSAALPIVQDAAVASPEIVRFRPKPGFAPSITTPVSVTFSEAIKESSVSPSSFTVKDSLTGNPVAGVFTFARKNKKVIFCPSAPLEYATTYLVEISVGGAIVDLDDNPALPDTIPFTTQPQPQPFLRSIKPKSGAVGVTVVLAGKGFSKTQSINEVFFGSKQATIVKSGPNRIQVVVPNDAVTDSVFVRVGGLDSNKRLFTVLQPPGAPITAVDRETEIPETGQKITVMPDGSRAFMTSVQANSVIPFLVGQDKSEEAVPVGLQPVAVAASPDNKFVYVANFGSNDVSVIDADSTSPTFKQVVSTIQVGLHPSGIAVSKSGESIYVVNLGDSTVTILDGDPEHATFHSARASANAAKTTRTVAVSPDGGGVIVGTNDGLVILDPITGQVLQTIEFGESIKDLDIPPNGATALVLTSSGKIGLIDIRLGASNRVLAMEELDEEAEDIKTSPNGALGVVTMRSGKVKSWQLAAFGVSGKASPNDPAAVTYSLIPAGTTTVGSNPNGIAFLPNDPDRMLVVNEGSKSITCLSIGEAWTEIVPAGLDSLASTTSGSWVDYDGDGDQDLYVVYADRANRLFRNDGPGGFVEATPSLLDDSGVGVGAAWGDVDRDGDMDLYLINRGTPNKLLVNDGTGVFTDQTPAVLADSGMAADVAWIDLDGDFDLDLYVVNDGGTNRLWRNEDTGFRDITAQDLADSLHAVADSTGQARSLTLVDFDLDGDLDMFVANEVPPNRLLRNDGFTRFRNVASGALAATAGVQAAAWGDYDNDGDLDVYLGVDTGTNKLLRNDGGGVFTDVTSGALGAALTTRGVAWLDYDNDADLDLYVVRDGSNLLLQNDGGGVFTDITPVLLADASPGNTAAWADFDADGDLDLFLGNDGLDNLIANTRANGNHWLEIQPVPIYSNPTAIGTRVRVVANGVAQVRAIGGSSSHAASVPGIAAFGLGPNATVVDTVQVTWPTGKVQTLTQVAIDQVLPVTEVVPTETEGPPLPRVYALHANYPNPFNPRTTIRYDLPQDSAVSLRIYDVRGRLVRVLERKKKQPAGRYQVVWDGRDDRGRATASGVYWYQLHAGTFQKSRKMVLVR